MKLTKKVKPRQKILLLNGKAGRQEKSYPGSYRNSEVALKMSMVTGNLEVRD